MDPLLLTAALSLLFALGTVAVVLVDQRRRQRRFARARSAYPRPRRPRWVPLRRHERVLRIGNDSAGR